MNGPGTLDKEGKHALKSKWGYMNLSTHEVEWNLCLRKITLTKIGEIGRGRGTMGRQRYH